MKWMWLVYVACGIAVLALCRMLDLGETQTLIVYGAGFLVLVATERVLGRVRKNRAPGHAEGQRAAAESPEPSILHAYREQGK